MVRLIFLIIMLVSCVKEDTEKTINPCWDCTLTCYIRNQFEPGWEISSTSEQEYCDKSETEINQIIREFETKGGNYTSYKLECKLR